MCGACEDEVFLTTPNPHCVLKGFAPAAPATATSRRRFSATEVVDASAPALPGSSGPLLSLSIGRARAAVAAGA